MRFEQLGPAEPLVERNRMARKNKITDEQERKMGFVKMKDGWIAASQIISLRATAPGIGKDGVERTWVLTVTPEAVGASEPKHCRIWHSDEEIKDVLRFLEGQV